jgi:DNA-binding winged helix-turn-helix (wHTH) protein
MELESLCEQHGIGYKDQRLHIDFENRQVFINSQAVNLTRKEFDLLSTLAAEAGQTLSHVTLLERVWGYKIGTRTRTLDVHICRVRKKLASAGRDYIETILGVGTRFTPWDQTPAGAPGHLRPAERSGSAASPAEFTSCSQAVYKQAPQPKSTRASA